MQKKVSIVIVSLALFGTVVMTTIAHAAEWMWNGYFGINFEESTAANSNGTFDTYVLSIISNVKIDEKLRLMGQIDWEHGPYIEANFDSETNTKVLHDRSSGEITLSNAYGEYTVADFLKVKAGKFFTPFGFQNLVFYALPAYPFLKTPRASVYRKGDTSQTDATLFQRYAQGVWLSGDIAPAMLTYDLHYSNGKNNIDSENENGSKALGARVQANITFGNTSIKPIVSYYHDKFTEDLDTTSAINYQQRTQNTIMPGVDISIGDLVIKGEHAKSRLRNVSDGTGAKTDMVAWYAEAYYTVAERFTPFARYEFWEPDNKVHNDQEYESTVGLAYHIIPWVAQVKAQVRYHEFQTEDTIKATDLSKQNFYIYSVGLALGF